MTSTFPTLTPSSRSFQPGNYPVKAFNAQDGAEIRFLYGDKRVAAQLQLGYANITDPNAKSFMDHYEAMKGTFQTFEFESGNDALNGWSPSTDNTLNAPPGSKWRYAEPPQLESVYPGISSVTVNLISATTS